MPAWSSRAERAAMSSTHAPPSPTPSSLPPPEPVRQDNPPAEDRSGGGAFFDGATAQARVLDRGRLVGHVECADVGAGRDDLVDAVEDVVGEADVDAGEQVVQLCHGAG